MENTSTKSPNMPEHNNFFPECAQEEFKQYLASLENPLYGNTHEQDKIRRLFLEGQGIIVVPKEFSRVVADLLH